MDLCEGEAQPIVKSTLINGGSSTVGGTADNIKWLSIHIVKKKSANIMFNIKNDIDIYL